MASEPPSPARSMPSEVKAFVVGFHNSADYYLDRIDQLALGDYPTELSYRLLRVFRKAIEELRERVDELVQTEGDVQPSEFFRKGEFLAWLHRLIDLVESSASAINPRWFVSPLKAEIDRRIEDTFDILLVPSEEGGNFWFWNTAYQIRPYFSSAFGPSRAKELLKDLPDHIAIFAYPRAERDNVLQQSVFYHEIAHMIDRDVLSLSSECLTACLQEEPGEKLWNEIEAVAEVLAREQQIDTAEEGEQQGLGDEYRQIFKGRLSAKCKNILQAWAMEFGADLIATRIIGPAYFFAVITSPALLAFLDHHGDNHPSTRLRLRAIISLLQSERAGNYFEEAGDILDELDTLEYLEDWKQLVGEDATSTWPDDSLINDVGLGDAVADFAWEMACRVREAVIEEVAEDVYTPGQLVSDVQEKGLYAQLRSRFTVNESLEANLEKRVAVGIPAILNIGWLAFLHGDHTKVQYRALVGRLVRKSIELSQIQRRVEELAQD